MKEQISKAKIDKSVIQGNCEDSMQIAYEKAVQENAAKILADHIEAFKELAK